MRRALIFTTLAACHRPPSPPAPAPAPAPTAMPSTITLPGTAPLPFDDLRFAPRLHRVLAPAGENLALVDPQTGAFTVIPGFGKTTSADEGPDVLFASDRDKKQVDIVTGTAITGSAPLAANPDYVRWVAPSREVWVTEPRAKQIEYFTFDGTKLTHAGALQIPGGPESLAIDATRGRAYTHTWEGETVVIDLAKHAEVARWKNGCAGSRGIALDAPTGLLYVGCDEGKATALDVTHDGALRGEVATGKGVDIIAFDPVHRHLYVPGGDDATLTIVAVSPTGALSHVSTSPAAHDSHCVTVDDAGHAYVCDPERGALIVVTDPAH